MVLVLPTNIIYIDFRLYGVIVKLSDYKIESTD